MTARRDRLPWTPDEIAYLRANLDRTHSEIGRHLGRSKAAVDHRRLPQGESCASCIVAFDAPRKAEGAMKSDSMLVPISVASSMLHTPAEVIFRLAYQGAIAGGIRQPDLEPLIDFENLREFLLRREAAPRLTG
jgi:hypothetical protein